MKNILVIAPHADDEVLGCGGVMTKYAEEGNKVFVIIATNAHIGDSEMFLEEEIIQVRNEAREAHKLLGVEKTYFLDFPAPRLDSYPKYKISLALHKIMDEVQPDILFLPHQGDLHTDHKQIFLSALVPARPVERKIKEIYTYETQSETEWGAPYSGEIFFPTSFEVLSESHLRKKMEAMKCFKSQLKESPNPRSLDKLEALAKYRGGIVNEEYAEAFYLVRQIR